jgi:hypothetical protein
MIDTPNVRNNKYDNNAGEGDNGKTKTSSSSNPNSSSIPKETQNNKDSKIQLKKNKPEKEGRKEEM